ncbi:MAG: hypothetical protein VX498_03635, partial [Myxococcota bacterium]|nr:hypothetical protein [Myxococcota bacterium]
MPTDIPIEAVLGARPEDREHRFAHLTEPTTVFQWTPTKAPKRVLVDPMNSAMVRSLKKVRGLQAPQTGAAGSR